MSNGGRPVEGYKLSPKAVAYSRALKRRMALQHMMKVRAARTKTKLDAQTQYLRESAEQINRALQHPPEDMVLQLEGQDTAGDTR